MPRLWLRPRIVAKEISDGDRYSPCYSILPRTKFLLSLEGWYTPASGLPRFKLSCRYRDMIRCSVFNGHKKHFTSCFRPDGEHEEQAWLRCNAPTFGIIYVPDKHGNFEGRAFIYQPYDWNTNEYAKRITIDKIYGNSLSYEDIKQCLLSRGVESHYSRTDSYL